jgi:hypothetical protein
MSGNIPGPREQQLTKMRIAHAREIFDGPEACNRIKDMTDAEIDESRTHAIRAAGKAGRGAARNWKGGSKRTQPSPLSEADKAAQAEIKRGIAAKEKEEKKKALERLAELKKTRAALRPRTTAPTESADPATQTTESEMSTKKKATTAAKTSKAKARTAVKGKTTKVEGVRPGSKLEIIVGLLKRKEGCTTEGSPRGHPLARRLYAAAGEGGRPDTEEGEGGRRYPLPRGLAGPPARRSKGVAR